MVYCSKCGAKNNEDNVKCDNCSEFLTRKQKTLTLNDFSEIFTKENFKALDDLTVEAYCTVIENIKNMGHYGLEEYYRNNSRRNLTILDKIKALASAYTDIHYKSRGAELGSYSFNSINIDDRLDGANQIATLIHELTHHLFSEIFEQILMYLWQSRKSDAVEALAWFTLIGNPVTKLSNEYCAHTCEGRFVPHGYQNYGSFNAIIMEEFNPEKDGDAIGMGLVFGNTIARDILEILEDFIDYNLRREIMEQFKRDFTYPPQYDQIMLETSDYLPEDLKIENIKNILKAGYRAAEKKKMQDVLEMFQEKFEETNKD